MIGQQVTTDRIEWLISRQSTPALLLGDPTPSEDQLLKIIEAATSVPDHGGLRPWRFTVIRKEAREGLGRIMEEALKKRSPDASEADLARERNKPLRAPMIIVVSAAIENANPKIPRIEQFVSVGAACQNMLLALHSLGYGGILLTGPAAYDPMVQDALGVQANEEIVAFLYVGTPDGRARPKRRVPLEGLVRVWDGQRVAATLAGGSGT